MQEGHDDYQRFFKQIPEQLRYKEDLKIPFFSSELEVEKYIRKLADKNSNILQYKSFLGGGFYEHYIHPAIDALSNRGEFLTAYTPYQPEISQGILKIIYEYQNLMCTLTGMPASNASSYDGATALCDAIFMGLRYKNSQKPIYYSDSIWSDYEKVIKTHAFGKNIFCHKISFLNQNGQLDLAKLEDFFNKERPGIFVFQSPNRFGVIEPVEEIARLCQKYHVFSVLSYNLFLSGLFKPPGEAGIDVVSAEGQVFGLPLWAGGPGLGVLTCQKYLEPFLTGRIVGQVKTIGDEDAFMFVREEREQHYSRQEATSNICTNQTHCVIRVCIYLNLLGIDRFKDISLVNNNNAKYFLEKILKIPGVKKSFRGPFFNEFAIDLSFCAQKFLQKLYKQKIFGGIDISDASQSRLLLCVTETKNIKELDEIATIFTSCAKEIYV